VFPPLYAIVDAGMTGEPVSFAAKLARAGATLIQLRDKRSSAGRVYAQSRELVALLAPRGVRLVVNDRADIAAMAGASGVHVGQDDLPVEDARKICPSPCWVGVSTHDLNQLREAERTSADYIAVGPIFPTVTKENPDPVVGLRWLRAAREWTRKPLVAIGGITAGNASEVYAAGADSVAVIRDLALATDAARQVRRFLAIAERSITRRS
jgi:thiamine-phosphate pyrophosphorylase